MPGIKPYLHTPLLVTLLSELYWFSKASPVLNTMPWRCTGGVVIKQIFLTSALDEGKMSATRSDHFTFGEKPLVPTGHKDGWAPELPVWKWWWREEYHCLYQVLKHWANSQLIYWLSYHSSYFSQNALVLRKYAVIKNLDYHHVH